MIEQEKQLLIEDLCVRLPYGVRVAKGNIIYPLTGINIALGYVELAVSERISIEDVRPYLRPMSSMTEEEDKEFALLQTDFYVDGFLYPIAATNMINWLNSHHFDYRGLIEKGLALEAPEGMYETKTE